MQKLILLLIFSSSSISLFSEEISPEVKAALNWNLRANQCMPPEAFLGMILINEEGVRNTTRKLNPGQQRMAVRKKTDYDHCIIDYKNNLVTEWKMLKDVPQYGITQEQAEIILAKMAFIQKVIESPVASPPESATE